MRFWRRRELVGSVCCRSCAHTASTVWADTAYRSKANEAFLELQGFVSRIRAHRILDQRIAMGGQIVDASLVAAPKQRNTDDEKAAIKRGRVPETWKAKPAKLRQKDRDARWTVKFSKARERADGSKPAVDIAIPTFGYQNHISIACAHRARDRPDQGRGSA